jgi:hypothetical protein
MTSLQSVFLQWAHAVDVISFFRVQLCTYIDVDCSLYQASSIYICFIYLRSCFINLRLHASCVYMGCCNHALYISLHV